MKVLVCIPCLLTGGTEIQTLNTVHALVQGGHKVTVACYFEHTPDIVDRYRKAGAEVILFSPEGIRVGGYKSIFFLYKHLRRIVRIIRPDATHVQYMTPGAMVVLLLWLMGVKNIIATAHTAGDIYKDLRLIHFLQRHCLRAFTCITERAERSFFGTSQLYTPDLVLGKRNHFTIYNCLTFNVERLKINEKTAELYVDENEERLTINVERLKINEKTAELYEDENEERLTFNVEPKVAGRRERRRGTWNDEGIKGLFVKQSSLNVKRLGVVSRLEPIKGMDLVVPAFAEVLKLHPDTQLLVVGDGSLRASMEQQAAELGCANHITWVGRQPQEELPKWYSQMDIVLMPSRSEGFGLTAIEAMACGCVMVASDTGGLPEVVCDGECGLLHRTEDIADMAAKISTLIGDNDLYNKLRAQSLVEVEKYSFERYASAVCDLYERLIAT